ncbi:MAG: BTAD domain-containing putative transcriptional regulator, partial [Balneolaceae bacterium]
MERILHFKLFGGFQVLSDDQEVTGLRSGRLQSLLTYLVLHRDKSQSRQYLSFLFWPDSSESQARTNLRQLLHHLRNGFPHILSCIELNSKNIRWLPDAIVKCDVSDFETAITEAKKLEKSDKKAELLSLLEEAANLYQGDLFPECYDEWIEPLREKLRLKYINLLQWIIEKAEEQRHFQKAVNFAERLLQLDPLREKTYEDLMRLHSLNSDRASSVRVYNKCVQTLEKELGLEPGFPVKELYNNLFGKNGEPDADCNITIQKKKKHQPLIGRNNEWIRLKKLWNESVAGNAQLVLISGEAGIGKTRLAEEMLECVERLNINHAVARCYDVERNLAYVSLSEWLRSDSIRFHFKKLNSAYIQEISRLVPELIVENPDIQLPSSITKSWQRRQFIEALSQAILNVPQPLLLFIDDMQWCDYDTMEWLQSLLSRFRSEKIMIMGTVRIEEVHANHPLRHIVKSLSRTDQVSEIELKPMNKLETDSLAEQVYGKELDDTIRDNLFRESEGNPLFLVESIQMLKSGKSGSTDFSGQIPAEQTGYDDNRLLLPDKVHLVIRSRFELVSDKA